MRKNHNSPVKEFLIFSQALGKDLIHIQGAGGNTSMKTASGIWVKASGYRLSECLEKDCFIFLQSDRDFSVGQGQPKNLRPSIETSFHIGLRSKYVVHTHFLNAIAYTVVDDLRARLAKKLEGLSWSLIPYAMPGEALWNEMKLGIADREKNIILLQNHGVIFTGEKLSDIVANMKTLEHRLKLPVSLKNKYTLSKRYDGESFENYFWTNDEDLKAVASSLALSNLYTKKILYPDQVVFLHSIVARCNSDEVNSLLSSQPTVLCIFVLGYGVLLHNSLSNFQVDILIAHAKLILQIGDTRRITSLNTKQCLDLSNWDAEKYRKDLNDE